MSVAELARSLYTDRPNLSKVIKAAENDPRHTRLNRPKPESVTQRYGRMSSPPVAVDEAGALVAPPLR